jgi:hypothetical protein
MMGQARDALLRESSSIVGALVNEYFRDRLLCMPEVRAFIESLATS